MMHLRQSVCTAAAGHWCLSVNFLRELIGKHTAGCSAQFVAVLDVWPLPVLLYEPGDWWDFPRSGGGAVV